MIKYKTQAVLCWGEELVFKFSVQVELDICKK